MPEKILTIIVPSYNMEAYLPKCLGSLEVSPELMERLEVLVVNDGSKDRTSEIAHSFAAKWPGTFKVIDKENGHYGSCINAALPVATGFYVKVLDADDWFDTENFAEYLKFLSGEGQKGKDAPDLVLNDFDFVDGDGVVQSTWTYDIPNGGSVDLKRFNENRKWRLWMHAVAYRTENLIEAGYRQTEGLPYTDQEWIFYPFIYVKSMTYFRHVIYKYLLGREGQTCDPLVYLKCTGQQLKIVSRMIETYAKRGRLLREANRVYLKNNIVFRFRIIYRNFLLRGRNILSQVDLAEFDKAMASMSLELQDATNDFVTFGKFNYRYVMRWRCNGYKMPMSFYLCKFIYEARVRLLPGINIPLLGRIRRV